MTSMLATDLDGTLLDDEGRLSRANRDALVALGQRGVVRVVATGRSGFSAAKVLDRDVPLDYLVVSSGAGVIEVATGRYLRTVDLPAVQTERAAVVLTELGLDFMVHDPIPHNHRFAFHRAAGCDDFERRIALDRDHARVGTPPWRRVTCQLLAVHPDDRQCAVVVARRLPTMTVLRTTSPLDRRSRWIELFPAAVSKSQACAWVARRHGLDHAAVVAVGNDTNDLDLLRWAGRSFVVANAHEELLAQFEPVSANVHDGVAEAAQRAGLL